MKTLLLFWGWTRNDQTHLAITNSAPPDWKIEAINYQDFIPHGDINKFNGKVRNFLKKNNIRNFYLMGHSVGGGLAAKFATAHPEGIQHLYLIDTTGLANIKTFFSWFRYFPKHRNKYKETHPILRIIHHPILHLGLALFSLFGDLTQTISKIHIPTTILWGEKDELIPLEIGLKLRQLIPNSKLVILPNYTHDWVKQHPEKFWKNIQ